MKKLVTYGVIKGGKIIAQYDGTGALMTQLANPPRGDEFYPVPVIKNGKIVGYQDLFGSMKIYQTFEGGE